MDKFRQAAKEIHISDHEGKRCSEKGGIHPLSRVIVTFLYILCVVSFSKYNLEGLAGMVLYIVVHVIWYDVSVRTLFRHIWPVLLLTMAAGIAAPVLNREEYTVLFGVTVTYGMLSMVTLILKGMFCVAASYILGMTAGIAQICHALRLLHVPKEIVTVILLMHRYLMVLIKEAERMQQAYRLRAPAQKGLHFRVWGSFAGLLLLRSMDRAEEVYESMKLRGFDGSMQHASLGSSKKRSILYVLIWGVFLFLLRRFPVFLITGNLFIR